jgi:hypothetical protein
MTIPQIHGLYAHRSAEGPALLLFRVVRTRFRRWLGRHLSTRGQNGDDVSFDVHVDQALSIARQLPTLHAVPAGHVRSAERS